MSTTVIYGEILLLEYGARPTDAAGRVLVRKFKFYEGVINLGSNSRKYQRGNWRQEEGRSNWQKHVKRRHAGYLAEPITGCRVS